MLHALPGAMSEPEITVSLRVMGAVDPERVARLLGRGPDQGHAAGAPRPRPGQAPHSEGLWSASWSGRPADAFRDLAAFCRQHAATLRELGRAPGLRLDVFVGIFCMDANCGFTLPPDLLATLGELDLPLDLDIYPQQEEHDESRPEAAAGGAGNRREPPYFEGAGYRAVLRAFVGLADRVQLVVRPDLGLTASGAEVLDRLRPHLLSERTTSRWPGTILLEGEARVFEIRYGAAVADILGAAAERFTDWVQPDLPEDPSLWAGERTLLVCTSHEGDLRLALEPDEERRLAAGLDFDADRHG